MEYLRRKTVLKIILILCFVLTCGILLAYVCPETVCSFNLHTESQKYPSWRKIGLKHLMAENMGKPLSFLSLPSDSQVAESGLRNKLSFDEMIKDDFEFDIKGSDVIVFLHIQKTGGTTFGKHLVRDLDLERPCKCKRGQKKCKCYRPDSQAKYWLFSRYSTGWKCGLHADWTELTNCVDTAMDQTERQEAKRRYFYITLLREPIARFLSEFRHVQRGATWKSSRHWCGGRVPTEEELPLCYRGDDWRGVTLEEFMNCPHNLAVNRQTRMLADLTLVGCYNNSVMSHRARDLLMLASAKENLKKMSYFGLCEYQKISQYLFESTFNLHFFQPFEQFNETHSSLIMNEIDIRDLRKIRELNHLDSELYKYAKELLLARFERLKEEDPDFQEHFQNLGIKNIH
ncbi:heparan-sulfate 6-O-sulfotransferase 2-like [Tachypleus tridentatus]|uniref:heparan-sulfate 6-O-sulfotransferase 2-like n=1 Tax=Tachypleus tridentatus TaxID=6853 RepID=UPI003FD1C9C7